MFLFCKPKPIDVYFYTTREDVFNHARPKQASDFLPEWWKSLPKQLVFDESDAFLSESGTLKTCPGVTNLYSSGFMFPLWSDLDVEIHEDGYRYQFADCMSFIQEHVTSQFGGYDLVKGYQHLKVMNPWVTYCEQKINFLTMAPIWNSFGHSDIILLPGEFSYRHCLHHNINLLFKKMPEKAKYSLSFGQPIAHVVPLTERPIKLHHRLVSEKEMASIKAKSPIKMMGKNRYRRAEKLCPHA